MITLEILYFKEVKIRDNTLHKFIKYLTYNQNFVETYDEYYAELQRYEKKNQELEAKLLQSEVEKQELQETIDDLREQLREPMVQTILSVLDYKKYWLPEPDEVPYYHKDPENPDAVMQFYNDYWQKYVKKGLAFQDNVGKYDPVFLDEFKKYCKRQKIKTKDYLPPRSARIDQKLENIDHAELYETFKTVSSILKIIKNKSNSKV
jgi:hypothetical protein